MLKRARRRDAPERVEHPLNVDPAGAIRVAPSLANWMLPVNLDFCHRLPKVELHAHISGSIRASTLRELAHARRISADDLNVVASDKRSLDECFRLFDVLHSLVDSSEVLRRITIEAIEDFADENVVYLELRTTPRCDIADIPSTEQYVETVLSAIEHCQTRPDLRDRIVVRLLLSISRAGTLQDAIEVVNLAAKFQKYSLGDDNDAIVGIDFSGNPNKGDFCTFVPAFDQARKLGFPISFHIAEVENADEISAMIVYARPGDRFGHALKISESQQQRLQNSGLPIEICPTSNLRTLLLSSHKNHPTLPHWLDVAHPIVICTDDRGVFQCSLTSEYYNVAMAMALSRVDVCRIARLGLLSTFLCRSSNAWKRVEQISTAAIRKFHAENESCAHAHQKVINYHVTERKHSSVFTVAVCGVSCSGKTTLTKKLANILSKETLCRVIHADDFRAYTLFGYRHVNQHTRLRNWEHPANAAWNGLLASVLMTQRQLKSIGKADNRQSSKRSRPAILLVEGHMLAEDVRLLDLCDLCVWIDVSREICRTRRFSRSCNPAPNGWDKEVYFDECLWGTWVAQLLKAKESMEALKSSGRFLRFNGECAPDVLLHDVESSIQQFITRLRRKAAISKI